MKLTMHRVTTPAARYDMQRLLSERGEWLQARGSRQWAGEGLAPERIAGIAARGGSYIAVREDGMLAGTITVSGDGDLDFWIEAERAEPAWYLSKMATSLEHGRGLGGWMLRWAVDRAAQDGRAWCRLDVTRYEEAQPLRDWYAAQGWERVRTAVVEGKKSGALFQCRVAEDLEAREKFSAELPWLDADRPQSALIPEDAWSVKLSSGHRVEFMDPDPIYQFD